MSELYEKFKKINAPRNHKDWTHISEILKFEITQSNISDYLLSVANNTEMHEALHRRSYVHQLGFEKYELFKFGYNQDCAVRMHIWHGSASSTKEDIHDHCFDFCSKILTGELKQEYYNERIDGVEYQKCNYRVDKNFRSTCLHSKNATAAMVGSKTIGKNEIYFLRNDELHKIVSAKTPTVTLLVQGKYVKDSANVLRDIVNKNDNQEDGKIIRVAPRNKLKDHLIKIVKIINQ